MFIGAISALLPSWTATRVSPSPEAPSSSSVWMGYFPKSGVCERRSLGAGFVKYYPSFVPGSGKLLFVPSSGSMVGFGTVGLPPFATWWEILTNLLWTANALDAPSSGRQPPDLIFDAVF